MKYIVFDLDGTLSDTQKIHQKIESDFLLKKGIEINPDVIGQNYAGRTPQEWMKELAEQQDVDISIEDIEEFVLQKDAIVIDLLQKGEIELMPYTKELLQYLYSQGYKVGLSSGACREFIDAFIKYFGFGNIIEASTSANEVVRKKPYPDVFLESFYTLEKQYGPCDNRWVIGDGRSDVLGGHAAGAKTIRLNYFDKPIVEQSLCNYSVRNLQDVMNIIEH